MPTNAHYIERMKTQLKAWDAEVATLADEGRKANGATRAVYDDQLDNLRVAREAAQVHFEEIRFATEAAGAQLRVRMDAAWDSMRKSYEDAAAAVGKEHQS